MPVLIYSFIVAGSLDAVSIKKMMTRALASTVAMIKHKARGALNSTTEETTTQQCAVEASDSYDDYIDGFFQFRDGNGPQQILHFDSPEGKAAIDQLRKVKAEQGEFDDEPSLKDTWRPDALDATKATQRLMQGARANVVLQHGGISAAAVTDLSHVIFQETLSRLTRAETPADTPMDDDPPPSSSHEGGPQAAEATYDPETDPIFLTGHVTFNSPEFGLPVRERRTELLPPRAAPPTDSEWELMPDDAKRNYRRMLESVSKGRQDHQREWDTPASKVRSKPKASAKRKKKVDEDRDGDTGTAIESEGSLESKRQSSKRQKTVPKPSRVAKLKPIWLNGPSSIQKDEIDLLG
ncbi:hypothetical protein E8E12_000614 [Didymella heteroderae]|uniref:Uncharacterized protein n=1 Tax=Didymella heteroderae TaxID=1769908 RepID=A0A9P4WFI8_9PLEO|nr:hypothetical protein E8E12_000614 [Didymella heteroderae]